MTGYHAAVAGGVHLGFHADDAAQCTDAQCHQQTAPTDPAADLEVMAFDLATGSGLVEPKAVKAAVAALVARGIERPRSWRMELPPRTVLINANDTLHWRKKAEIVAALRNTGRAMARYYKIPPLQRAHVFFVVHPDTTKRNRQAQGKQRRDPGNWAPSAKAAIDGMVDAGVLPDDNSERLLGPDPRIGDPVPGSQLVLIVTDLDAMDPAHIALLNPPQGGEI